MNHRFGFLLILLAVVSGCEVEQHVSDQPPNIIFILTDDQGWGDLSSNGNDMLSTPNIDKLADDGITFDRFFVSPVCSPTRAEILTGRFAVRGGVYDTGAGGERLDLDETTFAQVLQDNGYKTAAFGKWHNGMQYPYHPNARGFEEYYGFASGHWGDYFSPMLEHNGQIVKGEGFLVDDLTQHTLDFISENRKSPFFVYLPLNTPHSPMQVPDEWWEKFENADLEKDHRYKDQMRMDHARAAYAMVENIDWNVGRIVAKLDELDLSTNTIIVYLSDNGPNGNRWNDDMKGKKGSTDEGGVRSPLIMKWQGKFQPGKHVTQISSALDFFPTLLDLATIESAPKKPLDGKNLKPLLFENDLAWDDRYIVSHWVSKTSVRNQEFRLDWENNLFHILFDPDQKEDVREVYPDVYASMTGYKSQWEKEVLSELPENDLRTFPVGHPDYKYTQIPARDGTAHGNIVRSNRWPNCSYFTNWISEEDKITWEVEVLAEGDYDVTVYYTCKEENVGSTVSVTVGDSTITGVISEANDPPATGMENDRFAREESYVKDFKPWNMGNIHLTKGHATLSIEADEMMGTEVMEFRLMMFERIN